jgi:predicted nucleic acid-binding protein
MRFFDTNILVYAVVEAGFKTSFAEELLIDGGVISAQVLNEFINVLLNKMKWTWPEIEVARSTLLSRFSNVEPLTLLTNDYGVHLARLYKLPFYDALILASALEAGCDELITEDFHNGQRFGSLTIVNPFV